MLILSIYIFVVQIAQGQVVPSPEWECKELQKDIKIVTIRCKESTLLDPTQFQVIILLPCEAASLACAGGVLCHVRAISPFFRDGGGDGDADGISFLT